MSGSPATVPGPLVVRPGYVFAGETCGIAAWLRIGIEIADAPELNSPSYPIADLS